MGKTVQFKTHNYAAARKACPLGKVPLLKFSDETGHVLLPTGQHVRRSPKDRTISARQRRKDDKFFRRQEKKYRDAAAAQAPAGSPDGKTEIAPAPAIQIDAELGHEIARFSQLSKDEIVRMVLSKELPFNVAVRLEQHGKNRFEVLEALAIVGTSDDIGVIEGVLEKGPVQPMAQDSACPVPPSDLSP